MTRESSSPQQTALASAREQKIAIGEMREMGVRGLLVYCADYKCAHAVRITADRWPDGVGPPQLSEKASQDFAPSLERP